MHRSMLARFPLLVALLLVIVPTGRGDVSDPPAAHSTARDNRPDIPALINRLADPDPSARNEAFNRLTALAQFARPQLMQSMDSASPEVRSQISQLLLHRSWVEASDPENVKALLSNYADLSVEDRCQQIAKLAQLPDTDIHRALLRILENDPSASVRWVAADVLRMDTRRPVQDELRSLSSTAVAKDEASARALMNNAPLLAICGWAWRTVDGQRTTDLLSQAVDLEANHPSAMNGQLDFAYLWLIQSATENNRYSDALRYLRQQASRTNWDDFSVPAPIANLIAFHAEYGPFPGFLRDLQTYRSYLNQPQLMYAIARLLERQDSPLLALLVDSFALSRSGLSADEHCQTGGFLVDQGWAAAARCELRVALWLSNENDAVNPYFQLARLASQTGDELAIAQNLESALQRLSGVTMQRTTRFGDRLPWSDNDAWAEVHWHYLRAARAANDMAGVQTHLQKLMELDRLSQILEKDPNLATDIVPALDETGRADDAKKCFDAAYANLNKTVAADPNDPEAKNNLAWLCAECGQRLDEAVKLADQAVAAAPANSAYLDTSAEAHFRIGDRLKAIELEQKALQLKPGDVFMTQQLQRFQAEPKLAH